MLRFVVRSVHGRESYCIEHHNDPAPQQPREYKHEVLYHCEVPNTMSLTEAIRLYRSGVRSKAKPQDDAKLPPLAQILQEKREKRARYGLGGVKR